MALFFTKGAHGNAGRLIKGALPSLCVKMNYSAAGGNLNYETLSIQVPKPFVYHVELNRPKKLNAFNRTAWAEIEKCFGELSNDADCRVIILSGAGKHFTAGIDLQDMMVLGQETAEHEDIARKGNVLRRNITNYQNSISSLEKCVKPVISVIHGACVGAGVDLITAADIRYCSNDAWFQVKEVDIGMAADVGTLQRLPKIIGNKSLVRELCYTGRKIESKEALDCGLVSRLFDNRDKAIESALELANLIAEKSPVAVQTTKRSLVYSLDHTNQEGLDHIANINEMMLQSEDFINAVMAQATKSDKPAFSKL